MCVFCLRVTTLSRVVMLAVAVAAAATAAVDGAVRVGPRGDDLDFRCAAPPRNPLFVERRVFDDRAFKHFHRCSCCLTRRPAATGGDRRRRLAAEALNVRAEMAPSLCIGVVVARQAARHTDSTTVDYDDDGDDGDEGQFRAPCFISFWRPTLKR